MSAPLGWNLGPSSVCVLYYSKNTVLTALHWSLQQPFLTGCAVCNSNPCSPALAVPALPIQVQGGQGGGGVCLRPIPTLALALMRLFVRYVNTFYVNSFSYLMHFDVWITMGGIAYFDCHVIHGRAVQRTFCSESLSTPEQITRQAYARTTWLKRSASTTPSKQKSIMRVLIC